MVTYIIWRGLRRPPSEHPLHRYVLSQPAGGLSVWLWLAALVFAPVLMLPALALITPVSGVGWCADIAGTTARARERGRFDLWSLQPGGVFMALWAITTATLHRGDNFARLHSGGLWFVRAMVVFALVSLFVDTRGSFGLPSNLSDLTSYAPHLIALGAVVVGHFQSLGLAVLTGMLAAELIPQERDARLITPAAYAALETLTYVVAWAISAALADALPLLFGVTPTLPLGLPLVAALSYIVVREALVIALWAGLIGRFALTPDERAMVMDAPPAPAIMESESDSVE